MTNTKYQKYIFGLKSSHLKIGVNRAGAYTISRSVSLSEKVDGCFHASQIANTQKCHHVKDHHHEHLAPMHGEPPLHVVDDPEVLTGLLDLHHVHEPWRGGGWVGGS